MSPRIFRSSIKRAAAGGLACSLLWAGCQQQEDFRTAADRSTTAESGAESTDPAITPTAGTTSDPWATETSTAEGRRGAILLPVESEDVPGLTPAPFPEGTLPSLQPASTPDAASMPVKLVRAVEKEAPLATPSTSPQPSAQEPSRLQPLGAAPAALQPIRTVELFNARDLTGWKVQEGLEEAWTVEDGAIVCRQAAGGWLRTAEVYSDFELRFEYRLDPGANTGIGLRFPPEGSPTLKGIEIQLIDDEAEKYATLRPDQQSGSLYYQFAPTEQAARPAGEWNECLIVARGSRVQVTLNGKLVNDAQLDRLNEDGKPHPLAARPPLGHIGLQSSNRRVAFRNLVLTDLTTQRPSGLRYVDLVAGQGPTASANSTVTVDYVGRFVDGTRFDSSFDRGQPVTVPLNDVIEGWKDGIAGMQPGGKRKLIVPAAMGYGQAGVPGLVPPDAILVFEVDLRRIGD